MRSCFIGVDLGQSRDFTAIAVVERRLVTGEWDPVAYSWKKEARLELRYLERLTLGMTYPEIVERVVQVTRSPALGDKKRLVVDGTGVGRPVVDLLRRARPGCLIMAALITGGETESMSEGYYRIPKRDLITGLQVLLQTGRLRIAAKLEHARTLVGEMREMRVKVSPSGREQYGAWREGTHDDLVLATALACWAVRKVHPDESRGEGRWRRHEDEWEAQRALRKALL